MVVNLRLTLGHPEIYPGHLVLGLLDQTDGLAARSLTAQGLDPAAVRAGVTAALPTPGGEVPALVLYDARGRKALELTFREALRLGHDSVGTGHMLMALLEEEAPAGGRAQRAGRRQGRDRADRGGRAAGAGQRLSAPRHHRLSLALSS